MSSCEIAGKFVGHQLLLKTLKRTLDSVQALVSSPYLALFSCLLYLTFDYT